MATNEEDKMFIAMAQVTGQYEDIPAAVADKAKEAARKEEEEEQQQQQQKEKDPEAMKRKKEEMVRKRMFRTYYTKTGVSVHQCTECDYKTEYSTGIKDHVNKEHIKNALKCTECSYQTYMSKSLNHHRRMVHGLLAMTCPVDKCSYKSISLELMQKHVDTKHPEMQGQDYKFHAELNPPTRRQGKHRTSGGGGGARPPIGVGKGNGVRRKVASYTKSQDPITGKNIYTCDHCAYSSRSVMQLNSHQNMQHFKRPIRCTECNFSTLHYGTFYTHCKSVHKMSKRDCIVPGCKFKWLRDEAIQMHLWRKHAAVYDEKEHAIKVFV